MLAILDLNMMNAYRNRLSAPSYCEYGKSWTYKVLIRSETLYYSEKTGGFEKTYEKRNGDTPQAGDKNKDW